MTFGTIHDFRNFSRLIKSKFIATFHDFCNFWRLLDFEKLLSLRLFDSQLQAESTIDDLFGFVLVAAAYLARAVRECQGEVVEICVVRISSS